MFSTSLSTALRFCVKTVPEWKRQFVHKYNMIGTVISSGNLLFSSVILKIVSLPHADFKIIQFKSFHDGVPSTADTRTTVILVLTVSKPD